MPQFSVRVKDRKNGREFDITVDSNTVANQAEAEAYVAKLPPSRGGTHPGLEVIPAQPAVGAAAAVTEPVATVAEQHVAAD
jgi:hypothetical protein